MAIENLDKEARWYVLHTFSGFEKIAKENLSIVVDKYNLHDRIFDIVIPMEDVLEEKRGKKVLTPKKLMPGYIIVKMIYGDDIWHAVTRTQYITGFVGPKGRPVSITDEEVAKLRLERVSSDTKVKVGDTVEIVDGPLTGQVGKIKDIDEHTQNLFVSVDVFGRETDVEVALSQIRVAD